MNLVLRFINMATYPLRRFRQWDSSGFHLIHHLIEVCTGEFPFKWHSDCLVILLETR